MLYCCGLGDQGEGGLVKLLISDKTKGSHYKPADDISAHEVARDIVRIQQYAGISPRNIGKHRVHIRNNPSFGHNSGIKLQLEQTVGL